MTDETRDSDRDSGKIKVVDKRIFTADGELREDYRHLGGEGAGRAEDAGRKGRTEPRAGGAAEAPPAPGPRRVEPAADPGPAPEASPSGPGPDLGPAGKLGQPGVMDLIGLLAEPVAIYLGDAKLPDGGSAENLDAARFYIDLLEVLKEKTEGNLTPQESSVLEDLLYQLRMRYVRKRG